MLKEPMQQEPSQTQPKRDRDWQTVALCIDKDTGFCVEVRQDKACPWPKFSLRVGKKRDDQDHVALFIPVMVDRHQCTIKGPSPSAVLPALLAKAETFVLTKQAEYELEREHERQDRAAAAPPPRRSSGGSRSSSGSGKSVMRKGKTARDRANKQQRRQKERQD
jgi:hypothetical protein